MAGVVIVVTPEPLAAEGTLKIGHGIPVGLDAADQKGFLIAEGQVLHIVLNEIVAKTQMTFTAHTEVLPCFFSLIIADLTAEFVNKTKDWRYP